LHRYTKTTITRVGHLLKQLAQVREQNYALDMAEHEKEVQCIAAPVYDADGNVVAAISISGPVARIDPENSRLDLIQMVKKAAADISRRLGYNSQLRSSKPGG